MSSLKLISSYNILIKMVTFHFQETISYLSKIKKIVNCQSKKENLKFMKLNHISLNLTKKMRIKN
jgi:hypothetical protein